MITYYSVHKGYCPGIYKNWQNCEKQIIGFKGAVFKKFKNDYDSALYFYKNGKDLNLNNNRLRINKYIINLKKKLSIISSDKNEYIINNQENQNNVHDNMSNVDDNMSNVDDNMNNVDDNSENIIIYTDGSCINNGKPNAQAGIGIYFGENDKRNISEKFINGPTNQRAEIYAIIKCIDILNSENIKKNIHIYTDSQYTINCITKWIPKWIKNNWINSKNESVKNKDLLEELYLKYNKVSINLIHINSHTNKKDVHSLGNAMADKLALEGAQLLYFKPGII